MRPEEILEKHCPIYNPLFTDSKVKVFKANTVSAMREYAEIRVKEEKDKLFQEIKNIGDTMIIMENQRVINIWLAKMLTAIEKLK